jgi:hypothetical protein
MLHGKHGARWPGFRQWHEPQTTPKPIRAIRPQVDNARPFGPASSFASCRRPAGGSSLLKAGLGEELPMPIDDADYAWRTAEDSRVLILQATALGPRRITEGGGAAIGAASIRTTRDAVAEAEVQIGACLNEHRPW